jgi:hypothetical protein
VDNITFSSAFALINIEDNPQLNYIDLTNVAEGENLSISNNGPTVAVLLSNLTRCSAMSFSNIYSIDIPALSSPLSGGLMLSNNSFDTFSVPLLTGLSGPLIVADNPQLQTLNLVQVDTIDGSLEVTNNPLLQTLSMDKLRLVEGSTILEGNFTRFVI